MGSNIHQMVRSDYMGSQTQIEQEVLKRERAPQDVVLVWDQALSHGSVESGPVLHLAQREQNTSLLVHLVVKQY